MRLHQSVQTDDYILFILRHINSWNRILNEIIPFPWKSCSNFSTNCSAPLPSILNLYQRGQNWRNVEIFLTNIFKRCHMTVTHHICQYVLQHVLQRLKFQNVTSLLTSYNQYTVLTWRFPKLLSVVPLVVFTPKISFSFF